MVNPVHVNRTFADRRLTVGGSDWLWVVTVIMGFSAFFALAFSKTVGLFSLPDLALFSQRADYHQQRRGARAFHYMALVILTVATISYFAMASNLGQTPVRTEFGPGRTRSIFVRFFPFHSTPHSCFAF